MKKRKEKKREKKDNLHHQLSLSFNHPFIQEERKREERRREKKRCL